MAGPGEIASPPPLRLRLPWCMGDETAPTTVGEYKDFTATTPRASYVQGCAAMIQSDQALADEISARTLHASALMPCWKKGLCVQACRAHGFSAAAVLRTHKSLQDVLLGSFGVAVCRSGDALLYVRGYCENHNSAFRGTVEMFLLVACQSLLPKRSVFSHCVAVGRPAGPDPESPLVYESQERPDQVALPLRLRVVDPVPGWQFILSPQFAACLLKLKRQRAAAADDKFVWDISLMEYTDIDQNVLAISGIAATKK